ncbi:MAG: hypothetical protein IKA65_07995 [Lentisphaeria bacterium]|nr:hypothetical protein [Lentisphaeria bacterium]
MKGFNVFLAVVIFLLAAASAVFSYFLFEKRESLVKGHGYFAEQLSKSIVTLEEKTGETLSGAINTGSLKHENTPESVNELLNKYNQHVTDVVNARNTLANTLSSLSRTLEMGGKTIPASSFTQLKQHSNATRSLQAHTASYVARNNAILSKLERSGRNLGTKKLTVNNLKSGQYANFYKELDDRISFWDTRNRVYVNEVGQIASALKGKRPNSTESGYAAGLKELVTHARDVERQRVTYLANWKNEERKVKARDAQIATLKSTVAKRDATIKSKDLDIKRLERMLGIIPGKRAIKDGSKEALELVKTQQKGKIMEVDDKFGFVVISLGRKTLVQDFYEYKPEKDSVKKTKYWDVNPMFEEGMILTIARNMPSGEAEYINKVKIVRLDDNCSIAEPVDKKTGKRMRVGDLVYLADDEIAKITNARK